MRILVTGASGILGSYLLRELERAGHVAIAWHGQQMVDVTDLATVTSAFVAAQAEAVIHAAALARVADCQRDPERAWQVNTAATAHLARLSDAAGIRLVFVSTDLVFDGQRPPYRFDDPPCPLSAYGRSKALAETAVLAHGRHVVARVGLLYGPSLSGRRSFFDDLLRAITEGRPITLFEDEWRTPLALPTAARTLIACATRTTPIPRVCHLGGLERMSRLEMGWRLARLLHRDERGLRAGRQAEAVTAEPRPLDVSLEANFWLPNERCGYEETLREMLGLS